MRVSPAATRDEGVVIFDASTACDIESLYVQALELTLRRRGMRTLTISVALDPARMARALHAVEPRAVVLAGHGADLDALGRLVFGARRIGGDELTICDFRHALPDSGASTVTRLGDKPIAAVDHLIAAIDGREVWPAAPTGIEAVERSPVRPSAGRSASRHALTSVRKRPTRAGRFPLRMTLVPGDPLAHRALESLLVAEANVRRRLSLDLEREGLSSTGFFVLVVLETAGGELELRTLRRRLQTSKANATEVVDTLVARGLVSRHRLRRATAAPSACR